MKRQLLLGLNTHLAAREFLHNMLEHHFAELPHLLAFLAEVESEVEVVLGLEFLVRLQHLGQRITAVVDESTNDAQAEVGTPGGRVEVTTTLSNSATANK